MQHRYFYIGDSPFFILFIFEDIGKKLNIEQFLTIFIIFDKID